MESFGELPERSKSRASPGLKISGSSKPILLPPGAAGSHRYCSHVGFQSCCRGPERGVGEGEGERTGSSCRDSAGVREQTPCGFCEPLLKFQSSLQSLFCLCSHFFYGEVDFWPSLFSPYASRNPSYTKTRHLHQYFGLNPTLLGWLAVG